MKGVHLRNLYKAEAMSYPIDFMSYKTTQEELESIRAVYDIPDDVELRIPSKIYNPSRPSKGYVTLYLECFKLGVILPLQPYFAKILGRLNMSPG